jgi:phage I-like protein
MPGINVFRKAMNAEAVTGRRMALNFELPADGVAPDWIELIPAGQIITGRDGRTWINDRPDVILQAFAAEGKDLPVDWEHSSVLKAREGEEAPAGGWIKQMEAREGGAIWGRVEWTEKGRASIASREYRYLSPVFLYEIESRRIFRITSCGLTNQPNLFLNALNSENQTEVNPMFKKLLLLLGLPETTTEEAALNHVGALKAEHATALNQAQHPPLDKFVPRADYDKALNRAGESEKKLAEQFAAELDKAINTEIDAALAAGKITPATKEYHVAQCRQDGGLDRFREFVKAAPVFGADSGLDGREAGGSKALNAEEKKICEMMGISVDEYKKANNL